MLPTYTVSLQQIKAFRIIRLFYSKALETYKLTLNDWVVLGNLYQNGGTRLVNLASILEVESPLITNIITSLKRQGLVELKRDPFDKRTKLVALSKKAKIQIPKIEEKLQKKQKEFFSLKSKKDINMYLDICKKFANYNVKN